MNEKAMLPEQESADLVDKAQNKREGVFELSTGVVLKLKPKFNPSVIIDILSDLESKRPEPPVTYIEAFDREELNYDDPNYLDRKARWETVSAGRIADALILLGTEIEAVPKGMDWPADNDWLDMLYTLGFKINKKSVSARYLAWVKHVAIQDQSDWEAITEHVGRLAGVREADVKLAQDSFQATKK